MKKIILFLTLFFAFTIAASAQTEPTVTIKQSTAAECVRSFEREKTLEAALNAALEARRADAAIIATLKDIVELSRAETKELRGAVTELIKSAKPRKSKFCIAFCF